MPNAYKYPKLRLNAYLFCLVIVPLYALAQPPSTVSVVTPTQRVASQTIQLSGTVRATKTSSISTRVDGAVAKVLVNDGSRVKQGDLLVELDNQLEQIEMTRLKAELKAAQAQAEEDLRLVNEAKRLTKEKHLALTELALREADLAQSQADLDAARAGVSAQQQRLAYHQITAPYSGVVTTKLTEQGEWISRGASVLELVATENTYLDVEIPQELYPSLDKDTQVTIEPDINPSLSLAAEIATSIPVANAVSRTFRIRLVSKEYTLPPGSSATATFTSRQHNQSVLTIPRDALLRNPDNSFAVFVVQTSGDQSTAKRKQINIGQFIADQVEVISGLGDKDQVVVRGNEILRNDQAVKIIP